MNVEQELRQRKEYTPEVGVFDTDNYDIEEAIPYVVPGLTDKLKIKLKAESAAKEVFYLSNDDYLSKVELRNKLIYWAVVFGLALDDQAAYKRHGQEYVENFIEYGLSKHFDCYENLGLEILLDSGLDDLLPDLDKTEDDSDL